MAFYNIYVSKTQTLFREGTKDVPWSVVEKWLANNHGYYAKKVGPKMTAEGVYCDSGKAGANAVRIRVCDKDGKDLLGDLSNAEYNGYKVWEDKQGKFTNNAGELFAITVGMRLAVEKCIKKVFTDSAVVEWWIKGQGKALKEDASLAWYYKTHTKATYEAFKNLGGQVLKIGGDVNPADLGDHK